MRGAILGIGFPVFRVVCRLTRRRAVDHGIDKAWTAQHLRALRKGRLNDHDLDRVHPFWRSMVYQAAWA
jgi:hypothetical protein